ncbi:hypothetical protein ACT7CN_09580 [Bacillus cereus]
MKEKILKRVSIFITHSAIIEMEQEKFMKDLTRMGGTNVGNCKINLLVLFDGELEKHNCHPYWEITYYDDEGNAV